VNREFDERLLQLMPLHRDITAEQMIDLFGRPAWDQRANDGERQIVWCDPIQYWLLALWNPDNGVFLGAWCRPNKTSEDAYQLIDEYLMSRGYTLPERGDDLVHDTKACLRAVCESLDIVYEIDEDGDLDLVELNAERSDGTMLDGCIGNIFFGEAIPDVSHVQLAFFADVGGDAASRVELRSLFDAYNFEYQNDPVCLHPERSLLIVKDYLLVDDRLGLTPRVAQLALIRARANLVRLADAARAVATQRMSPVAAFERYLRA